MKIISLLIICFSILPTQLNASNYPNSFSIAVSKPYYLYLEDQNSLFYTDKISKIPSCFKLNLNLQRNYFAMKGKLIYQSNKVHPGYSMGYIQYRQLFNIDLSYGKIYQNKKFQLIPFGTIGYRAGDESTFLNFIPFHIYFGTHHFYNSLYIGFGVLANYNLNKFITIGTEVGYNRYFEAKYYDESEKYEYNFKINRNSLNIDFNLGFRIEWNPKERIAQ